MEKVKVRYIVIVNGKRHYFDSEEKANKFYLINKNYSYKNVQMVVKKEIVNLKQLSMFEK